MYNTYPCSQEVALEKLENFRNELREKSNQINSLRYAVDQAIRGTQGENLQALVDGQFDSIIEKVFLNFDHVPFFPVTNWYDLFSIGRYAIRNEGHFFSVEVVSSLGSLEFAKSEHGSLSGTIITEKNVRLAMAFYEGFAFGVDKKYVPDRKPFYGQMITDVFDSVLERAAREFLENSRDE